jgi:ketosteroid isomerase-like protein
MTGANKGAVLEWFSALSEARYDDAWALMDPAAEYWVLRQRVAIPMTEFADLYVGHMKKTFVDGLRFTPGTMTAEDDRVAVLADSDGELVSGGRYDNKYHFLFQLRSGLISHVWEYGDTYQSWKAFAQGKEEQNSE